MLSKNTPTEPSEWMNEWMNESNKKKTSLIVYRIPKKNDNNDNYRFYIDLISKQENRNGVTVRKNRTNNHKSNRHCHFQTHSTFFFSCLKQPIKTILKIVWKEALQNELYEPIIFIGSYCYNCYCDCWSNNITSFKIIYLFKNLI